jgi:hypothetical protein
MGRQEMEGFLWLATAPGAGLVSQLVRSAHVLAPWSQAIAMSVTGPNGGAQTLLLTRNT